MQAIQTKSGLYRFEAGLEFHPVGLVPEGLQVTVPFEGRVTGGALAEAGFEDARVWGVDQLLVRHDGVGVLDVTKTISKNNRNLSEHVHGYFVPPEGMSPPALETVVAPGFEWPDVPFPVYGFSLFRAGTPELAYLNRAIARIEGTVNFATRRLVIATELIAS